MTDDKKQFEELTFGVAVNELALLSYINSITEYHSKIQNILSGYTELPLFLDTNVLLRYYETSLKYRSDLLSFFNSNLKNIILTYNVQKEFVRNREEVIDRFISSSLTKFKNDFESEFIKGLDNYLKNIKSHLDDFPEIGDSIGDIKSNVEKTHKALSQKIEKIEKDLKNLKVKDDLLDILSSVFMLDSLPKESVEILKKQFDNLSKELEKKPSDRFNKTASIFPGFLDIKDKESNPYGDYILFHEMIKFMKEKNTDVIFLTYDVKGDWIQKNGKAHSHYVQIAYNLTGRNLFILDADRYFANRFNKNFDPVSSKPFEHVEPSSIFSLNELSILDANYFNALNSIFAKTGLEQVHSYDELMMHNLNLLNTSGIIPNYILIACSTLKILYENDHPKDSKVFKDNIATLADKLNEISSQIVTPKRYESNIFPNSK